MVGTLIGVRPMQTGPVNRLDKRFISDEELNFNFGQIYQIILRMIPKIIKLSLCIADWWLVVKVFKLQITIAIVIYPTKSAAILSPETWSQTGLEMNAHLIPIGLINIIIY